MQLFPALAIFVIYDYTTRRGRENAKVFCAWPTQISTINCYSARAFLQNPIIFIGDGCRFRFVNRPSPRFVRVNLITQTLLMHNIRRIRAIKRIQPQKLMSSSEQHSPWCIFFLVEDIQCIKSFRFYSRCHFNGFRINCLSIVFPDRDFWSFWIWKERRWVCMIGPEIGHSVIEGSLDFPNWPNYKFKCIGLAR